MLNDNIISFKVATRNFGRFEVEFNNLVKRARKLKMAEPTYQVISTETVPARLNEVSGAVERPAYQVKQITVSGPAPKLAGWTFIAVLQHEKGGNIIHRVPGSEAVQVELDMRTCPAFCQHCNLVRNRLDTYVVAADDGRQIQVGRNCLQDFTGSDSPESIARWAEALAVFKEASGDEDDGFEGGGGGRMEQLVDVEIFLVAVAGAIRYFGEWLSRTKAREFGRTATADAAWRNLFPGPRDKENGLTYAIEAEDKERASRALVYALGALEAKDNADEYEWNLRLALQARVVTARSAGIVASAISYAERAMGREMERKKVAANSHFQGTVGKRQDFTLTVLRVVDLISDFYPTAHLHIFQDSTGNRFKWKTAAENLDVGATYVIKGTVKAHETYNGVEQTALTRCKVTKKLEAADEQSR